MKLSAYTLEKSGKALSQPDPELAPDWFTDEVIRWVDTTAADPEEGTALLEPLRLHQSVVSAIQSRDNSPEVMWLDELLFVRMPYLGHDGQRRSLALVCGPTAIVSIRTAPLDELDHLAGALQTGTRTIQPSIPELLIEIFEAALRETKPAAFELRQEILENSDTLGTEDCDLDAAELLELKRRASRLACLIEDQLICLREIATARPHALRLQSVGDELRSLIEIQEQARPIALRLDEQARDLRRAYDGLLQEATNRRLNIIAVLSAIYLPATLIAGVFGMNFREMPLTEFGSGYFIAIAIMATLVIGQLVFFWRRGFFE